MSLPEPPVPADLDLRDLAYMPLDVVRLRDSNLALRAKGEEFRVAVILWCVAWHQMPASSLPNDDTDLCQLAGMGRDIKGWRKIKAMALHGFVACSDGRLYHPVIAEKALEASEAEGRRESTRAKTRKRVAKWRANQADSNAGGNALHIEDVTVTGDGCNALRNGHVTPLREGKVRDIPAAASARDPDEPAATAEGRAVCDAAEADARTHAGWWAVDGEVAAWIAAGADLKLDVIPTIKRITQRRRQNGQGPPDSPSYFRKSISEAVDARSRPMPAANGGNHERGRTDLAAARTSFFDRVLAEVQRQPGADVSGPEADRGGAGYGGPADVLTAPGR